MTKNNIVKLLLGLLSLATTYTTATEEKDTASHSSVGASNCVGREPVSSTQNSVAMDRGAITIDIRCCNLNRCSLRNVGTFEMCLTGDRELYTYPEEGDSELGHLDGLEPPVGISQAGEDSKPNPEQRIETQGSPRPADEKVEKMETSMLSKLCSSCLRCIRATVCQKGLDAVAEIVDRADLESAVDIFS